MNGANSGSEEPGKDSTFEPIKANEFANVASVQSGPSKIADTTETASSATSSKR
jgi:hypothetical protein